MGKTIEVVIDAEGGVSMDVKGAKGKECLALTKMLEDAIGKTKKRKMKREARMGRNEGLDIKRT